MFCLVGVGVFFVATKYDKLHTDPELFRWLTEVVGFDDDHAQKTCVILKRGGVKSLVDLLGTDDDMIKHDMHLSKHTAAKSLKARAPMPRGPRPMSDSAEDSSSWGHV